MKQAESKKLFPSVAISAIVILALLFANNVWAQSCCGGSQAQAAKTLFVSLTGSDANDGRSWATAKRSIRSALNSASSGDTIQVAQGEYFENVNLLDGINLLGGFIPNSAARVHFGSIINGGGNGVVVKASNVNNCILDGFTLTNGNNSSGGALFVQGGSLTISRNLIQNNRAGVGGGVYLAGFRGTLSRNSVQNNTASVGGGIYCSGLRDEAIIERNAINGNNADNSGGGLYFSSSSGGVRNNTISNNSVAQGPGGGIYAADFSGLFSNNLIHHNTSRVGAGGYLTDIGASASFLNDTVADNTSSGTGGGFMVSNFDGQIQNTIIWRNNSNTNHQIFSDEAINAISYTNIQGGYTGTGNQNTDPLFDADYKLTVGSPSINAGSDGKDMGYTGGQAQRVNQAPVAVCPGNITVDVATDKKHCDGADVVLSDCSSSDPDGDSLTYFWSWEGSTAIGKCVKPFFGLGSHQVTLTVSDGEAESSCIMTVDVVCTAACSIHIIEPKNGQCVDTPNVTVRGVVANGMPCEIYVGGIATTVDAGGNFSVTISLNQGEGAYDIAASAKVCGQECADLVSIVYDNTAPQMSCPGNVTMEQENSSGTSAALLPANFICSAIDAVSGTLTPTNNIPTIFPAGTSTVTFSATDACGHSSSCSSSVEVKDTIKPEFTTSCSNITVEQESVAGTSAQSSQLSGFFTVAATDTVDGNIAVANDAPGIFPAGSTVVTFTAADKAGNAISCTGTVTVQDTVAPTLVCPNNVILECSNGSGAPASSLPAGFVATVSDAGDSGVSVSNNIPATFPLGGTVVTFSSVDKAGNKSTCTANVTVLDTIAPVITCPAGVTLECAGVGGTPSSNLPMNFAATASDNCDNAVAITNNIPALFAKGANTITFTAADHSGNVSACSVVVSVTDTTKPSISCPADITVECEGINGVANSSAQLAGFKATGSDVCDSNVVLGNNMPTYFACGSTTAVTFTATDSSGFNNTCSSNVTVQDTTAPAISCPGYTVLTTASEFNANNFKATATDICSKQVTITNNLPADTDDLQKGDNVITFTASDDGCGKNASSCTAILHVQEGNNPTIYCPGDLTVEQTIDAGIPFSAIAPNFMAKANDHKGNTLTVTNDAPAILPVGTTKVTFCATDSKGRKSCCAANVIVTKRIIVLKITCPTNLTLECEGLTGVPKTSGQLQNFVATSSDSGITISDDRPNTFATGSQTTVTFTVADNAGNKTSCIAQVAVKDSVSPKLTCPGNVSLTSAGDFDENNFKATASDLCSGTVNISSNLPKKDKFNDGDNIVTFTATDESGNSSSCTATVTLERGKDPTIYCPGSLTVAQTSNAGISFSEIAAKFTATAQDYKGNSLTVTNNAPSILPLGTTTVTFTAADSKGRTSSCSANVVVQKGTLPEPDPQITCPANATVECEGVSGVSASSVQLKNFVAASSVSGVTISDDKPAAFGTGKTTTVLFTAVNDAGKSASCSATVTVKDRVAPKISCPGSALLSSAGDFDENSFKATATDLCSDVINISSNLPKKDKLNEGDNPVIFTATDESGNSSSCTSTITVQPGNAPAIYCPDNLMVEQTSDAGIAFNEIAAKFTATAKDFKGNALTVTNNAPTTLSVGTTTVTFTATDSKGKSSSCPANVVVQKHVAEPVKLNIACPSDITVECEGLTGVAKTSGQLRNFAATSSNTGVTISDDKPNMFATGRTTTVTFTVADQSGNTASCPTSVTVKDSVSPKISCPGNVSLSSANDFDENNFKATASDLCSSVVTISSNLPKKNKLEQGNNIITFAATDESGNSSSCTAIITLEPSNDPTIYCPGNLTVEQTGDANVSFSEIAAKFTAIAQDDKGKSLTVTNNAPATLLLGNTTVIFTATDSKGKSSSCSSTVIVIKHVEEFTGTTNSGNTGTNTIVQTGDHDSGHDSEGKSSSENSGTGGSNTSGNTTPESGKTGTLSVTIVSPIDGAIVSFNKVTVIYLVDGVSKSISKELSGGKNVITVSDSNASGASGSDSIVVTYDPNAVLLSIISPSNGTVVDSSPIKVTYLLEGLTKVVNKALNEGDNVVTIKETDSTGHEVTASVNVTLDSAAPKVVITSPVNGVTLAVSSITVNYTVDGKAKAKSQALTEGLNVITVEEKDSFGRIGSDTVAVTLKSAAPKVVITSPENGAIVASTPITVTYTVDGVVKTLLKELGAGDNTVEVVVTDAFGRTATAKINVTLNSKAPKVKITLPENGAVVATSPISVTYTVDNKKSVTVSKALTEGINTVTIKEASNSGNSAVIGYDSITVTFDTNPPVVNIIAPQDGALVTKSLLTVIYTLDGQLKTVSRNLTEGVNTVVVEEKDALGRSGSATVKVTLDSHTPLIEITSPANNAIVSSTPILVSYNINDKAKSLSWDLVPGQNTIAIKETDANGIAGFASIVVTYKTLVESALLMCPQDLSLEQQSPQGTRITLQAVASDLHNPVTNITSDAPAIFAPGSTVVTFTGNNVQGEAVTCMSKVTVLDTNPPIIDLLLSPKRDEYNNSETLSIAYVVTDKADSNPLIKLELSKNDGALQDITAPSPIMLPLTNYVGNITLTITTTDASGNKSSSTANFRVVEKPSAK